MALPDVLLLLLSALAHVYWNLEVKRSPAPQAAVCVVILAGAVLCLPLGLALAWPVRVPPAAWACVAATGAIYGFYYTCIAASYQEEGLSRAYPIARGVAPVAAAAWGWVFFAERPTPGGWLGIAAVAAGLALLASLPAAGAGPLRRQGLLAALGTGLCVSAYSAVDKEGVRHLHPALYVVLTSAAGCLAQALLLRGTLRRETRRLAAAGTRAGVRLVLTGAAAIGSYLLVLLVLRHAPLVYVVPVRSLSVVLSVLAGSLFLGEKSGPAVYAAAALVAAGITLLATAG